MGILNTGDYLLTHGAAADVAVVGGGRCHTYHDLRRAAGKLVTTLAELRLPPGSPVAVVGPNSLFWVAAYLATMKAGHVVVPLPDRLPAADLSRSLDFVGCRTVLCDRAVTGRFRFPPGTVVVTDEALDGPDGGWPEPSRCHPGADAALMFTSGTTARPKAVRITHGNIQANTESIIEFLRLRRADRALVVLPFFYCFGASVLHTHLRVGGRVVLAGSLAFPEAALDLLDEQGATVLAGVPSTFHILLRASTFATREHRSLRIIQQAGGRLPPVVVEEMLRARHRAELFIMYGQTEATARLSYLPPHLLHEKPGSIGRGIPGVDLQVLDDAGRPVAPGERGEIYARGPNISPGYHADPEESAATFTERGLRTGDVATVDGDGYIFIVDRRADFIKSWGYRIPSQLIEDCALRIDRVVMAAAVAVPDPEAGEAVALYVARRAGTVVTPEEVLAVCRQHLARHMVPRAVMVVDDLPLNSNGKVAKARLSRLGPMPDPTGRTDRAVAGTRGRSR